MDFYVKKESNTSPSLSRAREKPKRVALCALGISIIDYFQAVLKLGGNRFAIADETWVINKAAGILQSDLVFRMDDLRISYDMNQTEYINFRGDTVRIEDVWNDYLKNNCDVPIMTSKAYPEFPTSVTYPLEDVINSCGTSYFNTSPAYAIGYAIHLGVKELNLYGVDFSYPNKGSHAAESGRACVESLLHIAMREKGMIVNVAQNSTLLDACVPVEKKMYGYGGIIEVRPHPEEKDKWRVVYREDLDEKRKKKNEDSEKAILDGLLKKYKPDLLDAPERAIQVESLKGEQNNDKPNEICERGDECSE